MNKDKMYKIMDENRIKKFWNNQNEKVFFETRKDLLRNKLILSSLITELYLTMCPDELNELMDKIEKGVEKSLNKELKKRKISPRLI